MNDRIFKAAMTAALDAMSEEELNSLSNDHYIFHFEDWPSAVKSASFDLFTLSELIEYHSENWNQIAKTRESSRPWKATFHDALDALWALHDDPSEKTKVFLEWIAKQQ
jgi:hypothetical protein